MAEFRMPSLGADMDYGTLLEWLVHPGDPVHRGDIVAVVDTSKAAVEVECFETGVVGQLLVEPGTRVGVGTPIATIETAGTTTPSAPPQPALISPPSRDGSRISSPLVRRLAEQRHVDLATIAGTGPGGRITHADVERAAESAAHRPKAETAAPSRKRVSPYARRIATEMGIDLGAVGGSGGSGVIRADDVRRAAAARIAQPTSPPPVPSQPARPAQAADRTDAMRATIATLMARSKREIPHYYLAETIDLGYAIDWMTVRNKALPIPQRLVPAALLLKAAALAVGTVPDLNGFWIDGALRREVPVHLGVAISLRGGGLVAPAIHDAATLDLGQLMVRLRDLVARARAGRLRRAELSDSTITITNLGDQGVESILGVIYPPQVALVGFGKVVNRPWAVDGLIGIRPTVTASLAADHRATDGATGARYLHTLARLLQTPEEL